MAEALQASEEEDSSLLALHVDPVHRLPVLLSDDRSESDPISWVLAESAPRLRKSCASRPFLGTWPRRTRYCDGPAGGRLQARCPKDWPRLWAERPTRPHRPGDRPTPTIEASNATTAVRTGT